MATEITVSEYAIEYGRCDADGWYVDYSRDAVAWLTCKHDMGDGACRDCVDAGAPRLKVVVSPG